MTFICRDTIVVGWDGTKVLVPSIESLGVPILRGFRRVVGSKKVGVVSHQDSEEIMLHAHRAVALCTGNEPVVSESPGLEAAGFWIPTDTTSASYVPQQFLIMGGSAVGCEMATACAKLGARVTLSSTKTILPGMDPEAIEIVLNLSDLKEC